MRVSFNVDFTVMGKGGGGLIILKGHHNIPSLRLDVWKTRFTNLHKTLFGDFRRFINSIGIRLIKVKVNYNKQIENVYILSCEIF